MFDGGTRCLKKIIIRYTAGDTVVEPIRLHAVFRQFLSFFFSSVLVLPTSTAIIVHQWLSRSLGARSARACALGACSHRARSVCARSMRAHSARPQTPGELSTRTHSLGARSARARALSPEARARIGHSLSLSARLARAHSLGARSPRALCLTRRALASGVLSPGARARLRRPHPERRPFSHAAADLCGNAH